MRDHFLEQVYSGMHKQKVVKEAYQNEGVIIFDMDARVEIFITESDLSTEYGVREYKEDVSKGITDDRIAVKLQELLTEMARKKLQEANEIGGIEITAYPSYTPNNVRSHRINVESYIEKLKEEIADEERIDQDFTPQVPQ